MKSERIGQHRARTEPTMRVASVTNGHVEPELQRVRRNSQTDGTAQGTKNPWHYQSHVEEIFHNATDYSFSEPLTFNFKTFSVVPSDQTLSQGVTNDLLLLGIPGNFTTNTSCDPSKVASAEGSMMAVDI